MEIILLILKILGLVLLGLLGLALLLVLAVLFVPVRYKAKGSRHEELKAEGRVTWLLHILRIRISYEDGKLKTKGKLLFFNIVDSDENVEEELADDDDSLFPDDIDDADISLFSDDPGKTEGTVKEDEPKKTDDKVKDDTDEKAIDKVKNDINQTTEDVISDTSDKAASEEFSGEKEETSEESDVSSPESEKVKTETSAESEEDNTETSAEYEEKTADPEIERLQGQRVGKKKKRKKDDTDEGKEEPKKQGIVKKAKNLYNIKNDPRAREFYRVAKKRVIKIVRHILPRKLKGSIRFGTGDPCSTGKILGAAAMMYPIYGGHISVEPVFEEKALEFDLYLRGRIRVITVLLPALMTYWSRDFKYLRKKIKKAVK